MNARNQLIDLYELHKTTPLPEAIISGDQMLYDIYVELEHLDMLICEMVDAFLNDGLDYVRFDLMPHIVEDLKTVKKQLEMCHPITAQEKYYFLEYQRWSKNLVDLTRFLARSISEELTESDQEEF